MCVVGCWREVCMGGDCVKSVKYLVAVVAGTNMFSLLLQGSQNICGDCKYKQNKAISFCANDILYFLVLILLMIP